MATNFYATRKLVWCCFPRVEFEKKNAEQLANMQPKRVPVEEFVRPDCKRNVDGLRIWTGFTSIASPAQRHSTIGSPDSNPYDVLVV